MTDRELLELAAKAAGLTVRLVLVDGSLDVGADRKPWNPLTDDADAFRLMVHLDIVPRYINGVAFAWKDNVCDTAVHEPEFDRATATRRAIVRAAAEIGKGTK